LKPRKATDFRLANQRKRRLEMGGVFFAPYDGARSSHAVHGRFVRPPIFL
jgi:hypothetical protein